MSSIKKQQGLILIELIAVIVLVGIIAAFTTFFLYSGIRGYMNTKNYTEGALNAQMALDRISLELRELNYFAAPLTVNSSLTYTSEVLSGTRTLSYNSNTIWISIGSNDYELLENVGSFTLSATPQDLDDDTFVDDVAFIDVGFRVNQIDRDFTTRIFPRHMVKNK